MFRVGCLGFWFEYKSLFGLFLLAWIDYFNLMDSVGLGVIIVLDSILVGCDFMVVLD